MRPRRHRNKQNVNNPTWKNTAKRVKVKFTLKQDMKVQRGVKV
jgi:hypothetical protein